MTSAHTGKRLNCFYQNVRSVRNKADDLATLMATEHFDIIQLTETWIRPTDIDIFDMINNSIYSQFHEIRNDGRGGGVLTLIKTCLNPTRIEIDSDLEVSITKITAPMTLYVITFYNSHSANIWVDKVIDIIFDIYKKQDKAPIILSGDFNSPNWAPAENQHSFLDLIFL